MTEAQIIQLRARVGTAAEHPTKLALDYLHEHDYEGLLVCRDCGVVLVIPEANRRG